MLPPIENPQLIGHSLQKSRFLDSFHGNRFPHGWILNGQRGIGKATFAYHMARYILSNRQDKNTEFSTEDPLFRRIAVHSHGDFLAIQRVEDKQEITIDQARKVPHFFAQTPAEGGWRVVIIDEAERMNRSTMNAILKSLEEPPENTVLFLITHTAGRLLPTIASRCQTMKFLPLPDEQLNQVVEGFQTKLPAAQLKTLKTYASGSPGVLLDFLEEAELVHQVGQLLERIPLMSVEPALDLIQVGGDNERVFDILEHMILQGLHQVVEKNVRGEKTLLPLEQSLTLWEKITGLFQRCRQVQLDRKATLLSVFCALEKEHLQ